MRTASTEIVYELVKQDKRVIAICADSRNDVFERIRDEYPAHYVDYGIAESNMVASAAGLASCGKIPFIFGTSNFIAMRAFEFIRNDVALANLNVKFIGIFSGLARGGWGPTHQGTEELALLRCLPNLLTVTPATPIAAREATKFAYIHQGPVYIRLEASGEIEFYTDEYHFQMGEGNVLNEGNDVTIVTIGSILAEAMQIARELEENGIGVRVIDMPMINPIDQRLLISAAQETKGIIALEEHSIYGGLGSAVAEVLAENEIKTRFVRMGLHGCAVGCGNREEIRELNGISKEDVIQQIRKIIA